MASDNSKIQPGDRVEYPFMVKHQLGAEKTYQEGEVVDVINGVAGAMQMVVSRPDDVDLAPNGFRVDYYIEGHTDVVLTVRKL